MAKDIDIAGKSKKWLQDMAKKISDALSPEVIPDKIIIELEDMAQDAATIDEHFTVKVDQQFFLTGHVERDGMQIDAIDDGIINAITEGEALGNKKAKTAMKKSEKKFDKLKKRIKQVAKELNLKESEVWDELGY